MISRTSQTLGDSLGKTTTNTAH